MKRSLLAKLACIAVAGSIAPLAQAAEPDWRLAVQAWTFRKLTFCETIDQAAALGIKYVEAYPGQKLGGGIPGTTHYNMNAETQEKVQDKLAAAGVKLVCYGVTGAGNEKGWRKLFEFAKAMGIETITSEPNPKHLDFVEKLCDEYDINVAIHNHPKPSRYWSPDIVLEACKDRSPRLGACADTGHWARSGLDPTEGLKKLEGRIISLHFKDLNKRERRAHDVPWGTGACDAASMLAELKRQGFKGVVSVEYERPSPELAANVGKCAEFFRKHAPLVAE